MMNVLVSLYPGDDAVRPGCQRGSANRGRGASGSRGKLDCGAEERGAAAWGLAGGIGVGVRRSGRGVGIAAGGNRRLADTDGARIRASPEDNAPLS